MTRARRPCPHPLPGLPRLAAGLLLVALAGCGGGGGSPAPPPAVPAALVSPNSLDFGTASVGDTPATQSLTITNSGTAALAVQGILLGGADAPSFQVTHNCAGTIAVNATCTAAVAFAPTSPGSKAASIVVQSNASTNPTVALSGTATAPAIALSVAGLRYGATLVGTSASVQTVTVTNTGTGRLVIAGLPIGGGGAAMFAQTNTCGAPVAAGATCTITVSFTPTAAGNPTAQLAIRSNAPGSATVSLAGTSYLPGSPIAVLKTLLAGQTGVAPFKPVTTTLAADLSSSATTLTVSSTTGFPATNFIAQLTQPGRFEYVLVTGGAGTTTWTVVRAYNGTPPTAFSANAATVTLMPLVAQKGTVLNGDPVSAISVQFTASVGGLTAGTLVAPPGNGIYALTFADGETRSVTIAGLSATWSPALAAGTILTAAAHPVLAPAGVASTSPLDLLSQRFDAAAPVYVTQHQRLANRGAILTADLPATGAPTLSVDSTANFPQTGNFLVGIGAEDILVNVANASTLNVVARAQDGTTAVALSNTASRLVQVLQVDFSGPGGTQAFYVPGRLNSGLNFLAVAGTVGALKEYEPEMPTSLHFSFTGSYFELLADGNTSLFVIADGVVQQSANYLVESPGYGGFYWHRFDFGSAKTRQITVLAGAYPAAVAYDPGAVMSPWNRSQDPFISWDGDSFGQTEGYSWSSRPDSGGMGLYVELMLALGITQFDYTGVVGGTGYSQQGPAVPPQYPRPKYSAVNRVPAVVAGPAPTLFFCGLGHNDNAISRTQFASDTQTYWHAVRAAWPNTVLVATQYYFPAAGPAAPLAFEPNPLSTPNDGAILAALTAAGGPWIYINSNQGTWVNSSGASGVFSTLHSPLLTGTGYGGAPGYQGGHATGVGNGDLYIRDDGVHPSNLGAAYLGRQTAAAVIAAVAAL